MSVRFAPLKMAFASSAVTTAQDGPPKVITDYVMSHLAVVRLETSVKVAPHLPPVVAIEDDLVDLVGDEAFTNEMKQYTGFLVRRALEALGARFVDKGIKIKRRSRYGSGSIYKF